MSQSLSRRQFLKAGGATAAGIAVSPLVHAKEAPPATDPGATVLPYPRKALGSTGKLAVNTPVDFTFPDEFSPCVLVKMGHAVPGGVGPERDIVAYSKLCTHMGCPTWYDQETRTFRCGCHFSVFDPEMGGQMVCGQATENLPKIVLEYDAQGGGLTAVAVEGLIYGRQSNLL